MADETDMLRDAALEHLTRLGLTEDQITWEYVKSDTEADGTIIDQSIDAGSALTDGSRLTLTVAENPAPAQTLPVPDTGAGGSAPGRSDRPSDAHAVRGFLRDGGRLRRPCVRCGEAGTARTGRICGEM